MPEDQSLIGTSKSPKQRGWRRRGVVVLSALPAVCYGLLLGLLAISQRTLIYHPDTQSPAVPTSNEFFDVQPFEFTTHDQLSLAAWRIQSHSTNKNEWNDLENRRPVVLIFHGNGGNRENRLSLARVLLNCGCHVIIPDYRGYGGNPGRPSEHDLAQDALSLWNHLIAEDNTLAERMIVYGESLGGGVAVRLVADLKMQNHVPAALVIQSSFTSLVDAAASHMPWIPVSWLLLDRYSSIQRIKNITCPILQFHGDADEVVPYSLGKRLFEAAPAESSRGVPKRFVSLPQGRHNDVVRNFHATLTNEITNLCRKTLFATAE